MRIKAYHCPFLASVKRLDRGIHVQNPGFGEQELPTPAQVIPLPLRTALRRGFGKGSTHRIFAHHLFHPQQSRIDPDATDRGDVGIALMACKHREQYRSQHIALARGIGALIGNRACVNPRLKEFSRFQKVDKKRQLSHRGYLCLRVPFNVYSTGKCFHNQGSRSGYFPFTQWVNAFRLFLCVHGLGI